MERTEAYIYSARFHLGELRRRRLENTALHERMKDIADYAREVAVGGSWSEAAFGPTTDYEGWGPLGYDFVGTNFVPLEDGTSIAVREVYSEEGSTEPRHVIILQEEGNERWEQLAIITGDTIDICGVGMPDNVELTHIEKTLDFVAGHESK